MNVVFPWMLVGRIHSKRDSSSKLVWFDLIQDGHSIQVVFNRKNYIGSDQEFELVARNFHRGDIVRKAFGSMS
jgi:lysyl-tRNA synthetase class 2